MIQNLKQRTKIPKVFLTDIKIFISQYLVQSITVLKSVNLEEINLANKNQQFCYNYEVTPPPQGLT